MDNVRRGHALARSFTTACINQLQPRAKPPAVQAPADLAPDGAVPVDPVPACPPSGDYSVAWSCRGADELHAMLVQGRCPELTDQELLILCEHGGLSLRELEQHLHDPCRAVKIRRMAVVRADGGAAAALADGGLPYQGYDWTSVNGQCCENIVGYVPVSVGLVGPLRVQGQSVHIPMATTEGALVASTARGCKAVNLAGGVSVLLTEDGMTRGACVAFQTAMRAGAAKAWLGSPEGRRSVKCTLAGHNLYVRCKATTGDAMGMNMVSQGVERVLAALAKHGFDDGKFSLVSGNYCADKKPAAINWIDGRGKSVVAEAVIPQHVVEAILKTTVDAMVELNVAKNLVGSAMAGSVGGFNTHAANIVAAVFIATGQDPAQVVESSQCITLMSKVDQGLRISVSMPCLEVATVGGGTALGPQASLLAMMGVKGPHAMDPGEHARQLARIVAAATLAGELSTSGAIAAGHLVKGHMDHNRGKRLNADAISAIVTRKD